MMNIDNLTELYKLFSEGLALGGLLSAIPFMLGFAINALYKWANY